MIAVATELVYDGAGRVVASRIVGDGSNWTCTTYDARGRVTAVKYPAVNGAPAREVDTTYSADGLTTAVTDPSGTITTTTDLLGRTVSYTDAKGTVTTSTYDLAGRDVEDKTTGAGGGTSTVDTAYLDDGRVASVTLDGAVVATPAYDAAGELVSVAYPAGSLSSISRNSQGTQTGQVFALPGSHSLGDTTTVSQASRVISDRQTVDGATSAAWSYGYDNAGRLVSAGLDSTDSRPSVSYTYGYAGSGGCGADPGAGDDSARTSESVVVGGGVPSTTVSCTDFASRLMSASGADALSSVTYNGHGDATTVGGRRSRMTRPIGSLASHHRRVGCRSRSRYTLDAGSRLISRVAVGSGTGSENSTTVYGYTGTGDSADLQLDGSGALAERYLSLPGGVLLTHRYTTTGGDVWSIPDLHGDIVATTDSTGALTSSGTLFDPFGDPIDPTTGATNPAATPATRTNGLTDAWEGKNQVGYEHTAGLDATLMGARLYLPTWGQFTSTDPITGGNPNPYMYPDDPINFQDLTGMGGRAGSAGNHRHSQYQNIPTHELQRRYKASNTSKAEKKKLKEELKARGVIPSNADPSGRGVANFSIHPPSTKVIIIGGVVVGIVVIGVLSGGSGFALFALF